MNLMNMFYETQMTIERPGLPALRLGEFRSAVAQAIRVINSRTEKANEVLKMSKLGINPVEIQNQLDVLIIDDPYYIGGRETFDGVVFSAADRSLTMPRHWEKVLSVYRHNVKLNLVSYDMLHRGGDYYDYHNNNNTLYFNFDVTDETLELVFVYRREYLPPLTLEGEYNGLPDYGYAMLMTGTLISLLGRGKYFEPNMFNIYTARFNEEVYSFSQRNMLIQSGIRNSTKFIYGKEIV